MTIADVDTFRKGLVGAMQGIEHSFRKRESLGLDVMAIGSMLSQVISLVNDIQPAVTDLIGKYEQEHPAWNLPVPIERYIRLLDKLATLQGSFVWFAGRGLDDRVGIELELLPTIPMMRAISGGPLGPLLKYIQHAVPDFLYQKARDRPLDEVTFDELAPMERYHLLKEVATQNVIPHGRTLPVVKWAHLPFSLDLFKGREIIGMGHDRNIELVDKAFEQGLELKLLFRGDPDDAYQIAMEQASQLSGSPPQGPEILSVHTHALDKITPETLADIASRRLLVHFWYQTNLAAELFTAAHTGLLRSVEQKATPWQRRIPHFGYLDADKLGLLPQQLWFQGLSEVERKELRLSKDDEELILATPKMVATAFRSYDTYGNIHWDDPPRSVSEEPPASSPLVDAEYGKPGRFFGFETRWMSPELLRLPGAREFYRRYLKAVQRGVTTKNYHFSPWQFHAWYSDIGDPGLHSKANGALSDIQNEARVLSAMHYNVPAGILLGRIPAALKHDSTDAVRGYVVNHLEENHALGMLLHDWTFNPVLYERPHLLAKVIAAQQWALRTLDIALESTEPGDTLDESIVREIIRQFVRRSGLLLTTEAAIGMRSPFVRDDGPGLAQTAVQVKARSQAADQVSTAPPPER